MLPAAGAAFSSTASAIAELLVAQEALTVVSLSGRNSVRAARVGLLCPMLLATAVKPVPGVCASLPAWAKAP